LLLFQRWKNTFEISELPPPIDITSMQENNYRALTLVMIGDPDSVKGRESDHPAPPETKL